MEQKPLTKEQLKNREDFAKDLQNLLDSRNLTMDIDIDFPQYRELPAEVLLAKQVLENHKGKFIMRLYDVEKLKEEKKEPKK